MCKERLHTFYSSPNIMRVNKSKRISEARERRKTQKIVVQKSQGKRPPGRYRRRWEEYSN
jgi:hypothetical protein